MKITPTLVTFIAGLLCSAASAQVITIGLPAGDAIVNISGTQQGAGTWSPSAFGAQSFWYQPFFTGGASSFVSLTLNPGTYSFTMVNPHDASLLFPALTSGQLAQIFTSWTYNSPYTTSYMVFASTAETDPSQHQLFSGGNISAPLIFSAQGAYDAMIAAGDASRLQAGAIGGRDDLATFQTSYTFGSTTTLDFVIPDYILGDNNGGVSILVQNITPMSPGSFGSVPEPSTYALAGVAVLSGLVALKRRKANAPASEV